MRNKTVAAFEQGGYRAAESDANFVFVDIRRDAGVFQEACRQRGIAIGREFPPLLSWARISIGTSEEMDRAVPLLLEVLATRVARPGTGYTPAAKAGQVATSLYP